MTVRRKRTDVTHPEVRRHLIDFERLMLGFAIRVGDRDAADVMYDRLRALETGQPVTVYRSDLPAGVLDHLPPDATIEIDIGDRLRIVTSS